MSDLPRYLELRKRTGPRRAVLVLEAILEARDDMMAVIVGHTDIHADLTSMLVRAARNRQPLEDAQLPYDAVRRLVLAFELLDPKYDPCLKKLGRLRNNFAHDIDFELSDQERTEFFNLLPSDLRKHYRENPLPIKFVNPLREALWHLTNQIQRAVLRNVGVSASFPGDIE